MSTTSAAIGAHSQGSADRIDFDGWRRRIRAETFANYDYHMGVALDAAGDVEPALAAFRRAIGHCPSLLQAHDRLRRLLERIGRADEARAVHAQALGIDPAYERRALIAMAKEVLESHKPAEALRMLRRIEEAWPDSVAELQEAYLDVGLSLARLNIRDEAVATLRAVLRYSQDIPEAHAQLGRLKLEHGEVDEALDHMRCYFRLSPGDRLAFDQLNWTLLVKGHYREALEVSDQAVAHWPENAYFLAYSGVARLLLGETDAALDRLRRATAADFDEFSIARPFLGLGLLAVNRAAEAADITAEGVRQAPERPFNRAVHSICLYGAGRMAEAQAEAERAISLPGHLLLSYFARAQLLLAQGRSEDAEVALRKGIAFEPGTLGYYTALVRWPEALAATLAAISPPSA